MTEIEVELLESWLSDKSFIQWCKQNSAEENNRWAQYFQSNPAHQELMLIAKDMVLGLPVRPIKVEQEEVQAALLRYHQALEAQVERKNGKPLLFSRQRYMQVAAAFLILLLVGVAIYQFAARGKHMLVQSTFGQIKEIDLPDGSHITLNANSSIQYDQKQPRKVKLKGEAYFEVAKRPISQEEFQVITDDMVVEVLGTSFNVKNRQEETQVYLDEGIVQVKVATEQAEFIEMKAGEFLTYSKSQDQFIAPHKADTKLKTSWKEGSLIFERATLSEVLTALEELYGISFQITEEELKKRNLTVGLPIKQLSISLEALSRVLEADISLENEIYIVRKK
ncbi:MAG: FecR domain-containing protein [Bacteroidota bacterium]